VIKHHNAHTHPLLLPTEGNNIPLTGPAPEDLGDAETGYLEVFLTATDSEGLSTTISQRLDAKHVAIAFVTEPNGLQIGVAGSTIITPRTVTSWDNWSLAVDAPDQPDPQSNSWLVFDNWSDGGAATHTLATPSSSATYVATFANPQPRAASPLNVPLVQSYSACTSPNTVHALPLAAGSCTPPRLESPLLTTSKVGRGGGLVRFDVIHDDSSTPADETDVSIRAIATDVLQDVSGLPDYTGELILTTAIRITDRANSSSALQPATVQDAQFSIPINCVDTPDKPAGGRCDVDTTADTLVPGFAREGKRAVVSINSLKLLDAGPDGIIAPASNPLGLGCPPTCGSGDEHAFMEQGLFAP
jgi:hypothetical protein